MKNTQSMQDISDETWALLAPHLPGQNGQWGGVASDNRLFINAVFWILRTGAPWRDLPPEYGRWGTVHQRFIRWRDKRIWEKLLEILIDKPNFAWLLVDTTRCTLPPSAHGGKNGNQRTGRAQRASAVKYLWPWMRMLCRSEFLAQQIPRRIARIS